MRKTILLAIAMLTVLGVTFMVAEHLGYADEDYLRGLVQDVQSSAGGKWAVAALVFLLLAGDLVLPVPSSIVMLSSGVFLGAWFGMAVAFAGAMVGAWAGFYLCRWGGRGMFRRMVGQEENVRVEDWFRRRGVVAIILSRPVPMLTEVLSCMAGLSGLRPGLFTLAAVAGTLPVCVVYAWVGHRSQYAMDPWPAVWVSIVIPAVGWMFTRWIGSEEKAGHVACAPKESGPSGIETGDGPL